MINTYLFFILVFILLGCESSTDSTPKTEVNSNFKISGAFYLNFTSKMGNASISSDNRIITLQTYVTNNNNLIVLTMRLFRNDFQKTEFDLADTDNFLNISFLNGERNYKASSGKVSIIEINEKSISLEFDCVANSLVNYDDIINIDNGHIEITNYIQQN